MKSVIDCFTGARQFALPVLAGALLMGTTGPRAFAGELLPLKVSGAFTITEMVPIGADPATGIVRVVATGIDEGWGTHFGRFTATFVFEADVLFVDGVPVPLSGGGIVRQTNADGSTVTWESRFVLTHTTSKIVAGMGRFARAEGSVAGESGEPILNDDGTMSIPYRHTGEIRSPGATRRGTP
jgi:hypothetical protein